MSQNWSDQRSVEYRLGLLFGITMPVISALIFPTYVHLMPLPWMERARLLELQFTLSEIVVIVWAYRAGMDRQRVWKALPIDIRIAVGTLLTAMLFSGAVISRYPADALLQSLQQVIHLYFAIAIFYLSANARLELRGDLIRLLAAGLVVLAACTAWRFGFPPPPSAIPGGVIEWSFALPGFISVRYLGTWSGAIAAGLATQLLYRTSHDRMGMSHFYFVLAAAMTIWTGTRAAMLGIGAAVLIFMISKGVPRRRPILTVALLSGLAVLSAWIFRFDDAAFQMFSSQRTGSMYQVTSGRSELWAAAIARWRDSPWLGWGTGSLFYEVDVGWTHTQPHNAILQFLFSWGIVGAGACCWLLGRAIRAAHIAAKADHSTWPLLAMVYALLAMSMVDGALYYPRFIIVIVGGLALIVARERRQRDQCHTSEHGSLRRTKTV